MIATTFIFYFTINIKFDEIFIIKTIKSLAIFLGLVYDIIVKNGYIRKKGMELIMMKKVLISFAVILCIFSVFTFSTVKAEQVIDKQTESQLIEIKEKEKKELEDFNEAYGSDAYGLTAYILSKIRIYSIPLCFIGIAVGAIYQYVIGIRKLDIRDRGMTLVVSFVTILVICQILPLVFAIVVKGWRN